MNVKEIVIYYLKENGYDGLFNGGECACETDDLFPCGEPSEYCEPGYKGPCTCGNGCDWDIYKGVTEVEEAKKRKTK